MNWLLRLFSGFVALIVAGCGSHARAPTSTQGLAVTGVGAVSAASEQVALLFDVRNDTGQTVVVFQDVTRVVAFSADGRLSEPLSFIESIESSHPAKPNLEAECSFRSHAVLAPGATARLVTYVSSTPEAGNVFKATATTSLVDLRCSTVLETLVTRTFELKGLP